MQGREEYQLNISNMFAALESLGGSGEHQWGLRKYQNIKISAKKSVGHYELMEHKLWFEKEC